MDQYQQQCCSPVSYTHLDVYKRQIVSCTVMWYRRHLRHAHSYLKLYIFYDSPVVHLTVSCSLPVMLLRYVLTFTSYSVLFSEIYSPNIKSHINIWLCFVVFVFNFLTVWVPLMIFFNNKVNKIHLSMMFNKWSTCFY